MMKRSLGQTNFFVSIFGTFARYVTNRRGTFVENVKKNQPTLVYTVDQKKVLNVLFHGQMWASLIFLGPLIRSFFSYPLNPNPLIYNKNLKLRNTDFFLFYFKNFKRNVCVFNAILQRKKINVSGLTELTFAILF
jgi:hypothetical protein